MSTFKKMLFSLFSIIAILGLIEIGLRLFWKERFLKSKQLENVKVKTVQYYPHPNKSISYTLPPNYHHKYARVHTNSWGFRGAEVTKKKPGTYRIVSLGDSNTFGSQVNNSETMTAVLKRRLKLTNHTKYELFSFINLATPGYNLKQYREVLYEYGDKVEPDIIICGISIFNDFNGIFSEYYDYGCIIRRYIHSVTGQYWSLNAPGWFGKNMYIGRLIYSKIIKLGPGTLDETAQDWRSQIHKYLPASIDPDDKVWDEAYEKISDIKEWCRKRKIPLIFVVFPTAAQIEFPGEISRKPQQILEKYLDSQRLVFIDLFEPYYHYRWIGNQNPCIDTFTHPNSEALDIAGNLLYDEAVKRGFIDNRLAAKDYWDIGEFGDEEILSYGWSHKESERDGTSFRWCINGEGKILMPPLYAEYKNIEIRLKGFACGFNGKEQHIEVVINNKPLQKTVIPCTWQRIRVPADSLIPDKYNEIIFRFDYALSPKEVINTTDLRKLTSAVDYIKLVK